MLARWWPRARPSPESSCGARASAYLEVLSRTSPPRGTRADGVVPVYGACGRPRTNPSAELAAFAATLRCARALWGGAVAETSTRGRGESVRGEMARGCSRATCWYVDELDTDTPRAMTAMSRLDLARRWAVRVRHASGVRCVHRRTIESADRQLCAASSSVDSHRLRPRVRRDGPFFSFTVLFSGPGRRYSGFAPTFSLSVLTCAHASIEPGCHTGVASRQGLRSWPEP